ncbi:chaperonin, partial [Ascosphaera pollenicola]
MADNFAMASEDEIAADDINEKQPETRPSAKMTNPEPPDVASPDENLVFIYCAHCDIPLARTVNKFYAIDRINGHAGYAATLT